MRIIRLFERGAHWLAFRQPDRPEISQTVGDACRDAYARGGWLILIRTGLAEWASLVHATLAPGAARWYSPGRRPAHRSPRVPRFFMRHLAHDLRQGWRGLAAARGHTALVIAILALGIGINTVVFSVIDSVLLRPVPYAESDRLARLWSYYAPGKFTMKGHFDTALVAEWRKQTDLFDRVEAAETRSFIYDDGRTSEMVNGSVVTPGLFPMLGVSARAGRVFQPGDGRDGTDRVVVISERFWRKRLQADPSAVGRELRLDEHRYQIIGVVPDTFRYPDESQELWLPLDVTRPQTARSGQTSFEPLVRLQPGLSRAQAGERVMARGADVNKAAGGDGQGSARLMSLGEVWDQRTTRSLLVLGGAVGFLLLIVCANVANLTVARSLARARDRAIRTALGASRGALVREALVEHVLVGVLAAAGGLAIARALLTITVTTLPENFTAASLNAIDLDGRALLFLTAAAIASMLLFGLPPAIFGARTNVASALGRDSRGAAGSRLARRVRAALVVVEVALSIVLLVGAALTTRSLLKLQAIDIGLDTNGLVGMTLALPRPGFTDQKQQTEITTQLIDRIRHLPGVTAISAGGLPPGEGMITVGPVEFAERPGEPTRSMMFPVYDVWPGYFSAAGIRLIEGRDFQWPDVEGAAIVSRELASRFWPGRSAIGARFKIGKGPWRTVIGVAAEVRRMSEDDDSKNYELYYPYDQVSNVMVAARQSSTIAAHRQIFVRGPRPGELFTPLARAVHELDSRVVVSGTTLVVRRFADAIARPRIVFVMMTVFSIFGLVLAAAGLYAVLSYLVAQRQREIGIRYALGARPRDVRRLILGSALTICAMGVVLGFAASAGLVQAMRTLLYEIEPFDPWSLTAVACLLTAAAVLACWRPMRRAMRVDPVTLLRES